MRGRAKVTIACVLQMQCQVKIALVYLRILVKISLFDDRWKRQSEIIGTAASGRILIFKM